MTTLKRDVKIPLSVKPRMRAAAAASKSTLGNDVAAIVTDYAEGRYTDGTGIHIDDVADPGLQDTDVKVTMNIAESTWEAARTRAILDNTTLASVVRRATLALHASE
ncbi:MAG: hypothetical protein ABWY36_05380 [Leifsonia sp.]